MKFTETTVNLPDDYEGTVIATLIQANAPQPSEHAVLYLHGYVDYFFQEHMAERFTDDGWNFYALDLRKYGRSLLPHQHPNYCRSLREYYPEIDTAISAIRTSGNHRIVLLGHSTGGLLASLYTADGKERKHIDKLILNSPFFEFNTTWFKRRIAIPVTSLLSLVFPYAHKQNELSPYYADSVHRSLRGEWNYDLKWKPREGIPLYFAWLRAVRRGQKQLKRGLHIRIPVLVMHSDRSSMEPVWNDLYTRTDAVLNVEDIKRYIPCLGDNLTDMEIAGGLHDLVLSAPEVRERVFRQMLAWLDNKKG